MTNENYVVVVNGGEYVISGFKNEAEARQFIFENEVEPFFSEKDIEDCMEEYAVTYKHDVTQFFDTDMYCAKAYTVEEYNKEP